MSIEVGVNPNSVSHMKKRVPRTNVLYWVAASCITLIVSLLSWGTAFNRNSDQFLVLLLCLFAGALLFKISAGPLKIMNSLASLRIGTWAVLGYIVTTAFGFPSFLSELDLRGTEHSGFGSQTQAVMLIACFTFVTGYRFCPNILTSRINVLTTRGCNIPNRRITAAGILVLWLISVFAVSVQIAIGTFGYFSDPSVLLSTESSLNTLLSSLVVWGWLACLSAGWFASQSPGWRRKIFVGFIVVSQAIIGLSSGGRETALAPVLLALLGYVAQNRKKKALIVGATIVPFAFIVLTPVIDQYRSQVIELGSRNSSTSNFEALSSILFSSNQIPTTRNDMTDPISRFSSRFGRAIDVSVVIEKAPSSILYREWTEIPVGLMFGIIPRSIWPDKPVLAPGREMSIDFYGINSRIYTSSALTPTGDLWRHGGLPILIVGSCFLGVFARTLDPPFRHHSALVSLFLPSLVVIHFFKAESGYTQLILGSCISALSAFLAVLISSKLSMKNADPNGVVEDYLNVPSRRRP